MTTKTKNTPSITKPKLPQGFKTKWVNALRSGNYTRGEGKMYDPKTGCYDALGVAHRVAGVPKSEIANEHGPSAKYRFLPNMLVENAELVNKFIDFNDKGMSFKWTAAYIEHNL